MQDGQTPPPAPQQPPQSTWQFEPESQPAPSPESASTPPAQVTWTASEFVAHQKTAGWYGTLVGLTVLVAGVVFILTKDVVSTVVVGIVGLSFGFFAARKPRELQYELDTTGIHMGDKLYPYAQFKSFSLMQEDAAASVWLMPLKRFMPILTVYFDPKDRDTIAGTLSNYLPHEDRQPDAVDRLMHRLRF